MMNTEIDESNSLAEEEDREKQEEIGESLIRQDKVGKQGWIHRIPIPHMALLDALWSAIFNILGAGAITAAVFEKNHKVYKKLQEWEKPWLVWPWDVLMIILMVVFNTLSVKYKLISFKYNGAFIGSTLIVVYSFLIAGFGEMVLEDKVPTVKQTAGAALMIFGITLVSFDTTQTKQKKSKTSGEKQDLNESLVEEDCSFISDEKQNDSLIDKDLESKE